MSLFFSPYEKDFQDCQQMINQSLLSDDLWLRLEILNRK